MARRHVETKQRVAELIAEGLNHTQIARALGVAKHTVSYHARTLGLPADPRFTRRYDWADVQRYYDEGHSVTGCQERFGFARETWTQHDAAAMSWHGINDDNRIENLAVLCPNCHSQTENFAGRNRRADAEAA